jgi:hypothetical protein
MRPATKRRVIWGTAIFVVLVAFVIGMLTFADSYALTEGTKRCAPGFWKSQWPMYFGCAMAAHEDLAAGLFGGAGALFAARLAFDAIQEQLGEERERRLSREVDAKKRPLSASRNPSTPRPQPTTQWNVRSPLSSWRNNKMPTRP